MGELGGEHYIAFKLPPGPPPPELTMALGGLRAVVARLGGQTHEYVAHENMDIMTDTGLRNTARCVDYMRGVGLLDQDRLIADLTIGTDPQERFGDARTLRGANTLILHNLTADPEDAVTTVPALLAMTDVDLVGRVGISKIPLLRRALVDSGVPSAYPWPQSGRLRGEPALLRSVALLAPTLEALPSWTTAVLARYLLDISMAEEIPQDRLAEASAAYRLQREEVLRAVGA